MSMMINPYLSGGSGGGPPADPYFASTVLLLGFEGTDGATATSDESAAANGFAAWFGNAQIDTAQKKFGTSSLLLDGAGDFINWADDNDFEFGSGDFTIEAFVRFNATTSFRTIIAKWQSINQHSFLLDYASGTGLRLGLATASSGADTFVQKAWSPSTGVWYHVCAERSGNTIRLYVDGVMLGTSSSFSGTIFNSASDVAIGGLSTAGGNYWNGWIDEVRITKGVARYASDSGFTVPSAAYPRS